MTLGDIIKLQRGFDITKADQEDGQYPVISSSGIKSFHNEFKVEGPGVVIGRKGTLGTVFYSDGPYWPHDTSLWVKDFKGNYPKYIYYFLKTLPLEKLDVGSANPTLNRNHVHLIEADAPPVEEQKRIASILSALDSKIVLNNRINAELEAMAKTIYDYWFVQFDFPISVGYAASVGQPELEGKPYKNSGGEMVWNGEIKREVPKGWEIGSLLDIAKFTNGLACQKFRPIDENRLPVIKIREMRDGITANSEFVRADIPEKLIVQNGDVLFSWSASLEVQLWTGGKGGLNQHIFKVISKEYPKSFYYFQLKNYLNYFKRVAELRKTTMGHITRDHLKQSRIAIPPKAIVEKLDTVLAPMLKRMVATQVENQELASLRDWLLPMLMNGQVKVGEAMKEYLQDGEVGIAAEAKEQYGKLTIPENKAPFAKQVLGGKIVSLFKDDPHFTHIKFQKLQYLAEQIAEADLNWNYYRQSAGPYDPRFMHSVALKLKRSKWFTEKNYRYYPLEKADQIEKYYQGYYGPMQEKLEHLFEKLQNATEDQSEIIATLYAVWNNRILERKAVSDPFLISDFRKWSSRKKRYSDDQLMKALEWMREHDFEPRGFGYKIKEKKS